MTILKKYDYTKNINFNLFELIISMHTIWLLCFNDNLITSGFQTFFDM